MSNTQEIGWKAVSKTGVVAAGGAKAVAAGIEFWKRVEMPQMQPRERFLRSMSQTMVPVLSGVRCRFLSLTRQNRK